MSEQKYGAQPPPELAWQIGKTVATLDFVREAEQALAGTELEPDETYKLEAKIERLKDGSESLEDDETLDVWLERLRDHYP